MGAKRRSNHGERDTKTIVFLAAPRTQILDVAGPFQVFVRAAEIFVRDHPARKQPYRTLLVSTTGRRTVSTNCGLVIGGSGTFRSLRGPIDTLLVAGGSGVEDAARSRELLLWLRRASRRVRRIGSICTGAFVLASAGLLKGKRAATHWKWAPELARRFKDTIVDPEPIFVRDGNTYTTAGVTAGMDLALALVEEDLGSAIALSVARELVLYLRRAGGQSQFSPALALQASDRKQIEDLRSWVVDNPDRDLRVARLASRAGMSPRNFARVFLSDTGLTPARFVERSRVEAARRRLEESRDKLEKIASDCGLGSVQGLRRSFRRLLGVAPSEYRSRFRDPQQGPAVIRRRAPGRGALHS
ncbi:MAG TPA: GlxA family transcriptional regulator [Thermoanaerobaculia bacterium]|nr:GlxA family transcriptional regulator [Thermoanaerobaculia bacterium]